MLAGGGIKGGQAIGKTSKDGTTVEERPTNTLDMLATLCMALGIDYEKTNPSNVGRPIRIVDKPAKPDQGGGGVTRSTLLGTATLLLLGGTVLRPPPAGRSVSRGKPSRFADEPSQSAHRLRAAACRSIHHRAHSGPARGDSTAVLPFDRR